MNKSDSITEIAKALNAFQADVGNIPKDSTNPFYKSKYASLESTIDTIKPALKAHGLSFAQFPSFEGLTTIIMHTSGEWISCDARITIKDQTPQGQGSALTYMRRYALSGALGLATEDDDDGNTASKPPVKAPQRVTEPPVDPKEEKEKVIKGEIKTICDTLSLVPLFSRKDYIDYIKTATNLTLGEDNAEDILKRLKAL